MDLLLIQTSNSVSFLQKLRYCIDSKLDMDIVPPPKPDLTINAPPPPPPTTTTVRSNTPPPNTSNFVPDSPPHPTPTSQPPLIDKDVDVLDITPKPPLVDLLHDEDVDVLDITPKPPLVDLCGDDDDYMSSGTSVSSVSSISSSEIFKSIKREFKDVPNCSEFLHEFLSKKDISGKQSVEFLDKKKREFLNNNRIYNAPDSQFKTIPLYKSSMKDMPIKIPKKFVSQILLLCTYNLIDKSVIIVFKNETNLYLYGGDEKHIKRLKKDFTRSEDRVVIYEVKTCNRQLFINHFKTLLSDYFDKFMAFSGPCRFQSSTDLRDVVQFCEVISYYKHVKK
ncbi:hypothetical protein SlGVgp020 [Spodoptera litura granulovirus]|uniref:Uncharacterized protein n=1 Tax=Spodoptera litura granulovirus TaxID=359919 RepID=A5IZM2_9BBAC|nr:hypothetical protein SlGVgp020 [Spodoptera litura granulovirus]ABQ51963.1 hypothetical protein SlGVgp020 [Spodoptera litura granulovirus]